MWQRITAVCIVFVLAACQSYTLVSADRVDIGGAFSVDPQVDWNKTKTLGIEMWTVDGPRLQKLHFAAGIGDGEPLYDLPGKDQDETMPAFRTSLSLSELVEFVTTSMTRAGAGQVEPLNIRPTSVAGVDGVRFELSFLSLEGLEQDGIVLAWVMDEELSVIIYSGARRHYFPKYVDDVERMIQSIEI